MAEPTYYLAPLSAVWDEAEGLHGLRVDVPATVADSYVTPGQYVQMRVPGHAAAFLAIASAPGEAQFEFLVKAGHGPVDALRALAAGASVEVTAAQGRGYPIDTHNGKDVLLFAVGSGISPIRSLIRHLSRHRADYASVALFFGARTPAHFAYRDEVAQWRAAGIKVVHVLSQPAPDAAPDPGVIHGYVQSALAAHPVDAARTVAFVCGMPGMVEGVTAELGRLGVPAERIYQNH